MASDPGTHDATVAALLARETGAPADPDRLTTLLELLGRPDQGCPSIMVAGDPTGVVARMVGALIGSLGLAPGLLLAGHLHDVRERILVAGAPIDADTLTRRFGEIEPLLLETDARHAEPVTFDEAVAALALAHFADTPVEVAVIASGGAGWDASSVARADVVVATASAPGSAIDIAALRGLIRADAMVVADEPAVRAVGALPGMCDERGARLVAVGGDAVTARRLAVGGQHLDLTGRTAPVGDVYVPLHGEHQALPAALALTAVEGFLGFAGGLDADVIREGFAAVRLPGRLEVVRRTDAATVVLDVVTGRDEAAALAAALSTEFGFRHRVVVAAPDGDEADETALEPLARSADHLVVVGDGRDAAAMAAAARDAARSVETAADAVSAIELASGLAAAEDGVVVAGPAHVIGAARRALGLGLA